MDSVTEYFGKTIDRLSPKHPSLVRWLLRTAYRADGAAKRFMPGKDILSSRRYLYAVTAKNIADGFKNDSTALVNIFMPCQILHAMGIETVMAEGLSCYITGADAEEYFLEVAERNGIPETLCTYHRVLMGCIESGVLPKPKFILYTTLACDTNQLSFRRMAEYYSIPKFVVDVPDKLTDDNLVYVADQLRAMKSFVEEQSGRKMSDDRLAQSMEWTREAIENYKAYLNARATRWMPDTMSSEMMDVFATQTSLGKREIADYTRRLRKEVEVLPEGLRGPRLFWIHVLPNANVQLNGLLGCDGGTEIAANDMATSALTDIDVSNPYESMARRLLESSLNGPIERRVEQAYKYAKMLNADGIVYFCHWGCLHTIGGSQYAKKYFEERGIPTLILDGDGCDRGQSGSGRTVVRVQAFIEQLERAGGERR